ALPGIGFTSGKCSVWQHAEPGPDAVVTSTPAVYNAPVPSAGALVPGVAFGYTPPSHFHEVAMRRTGLAVVLLIGLTLTPIAPRAPQKAMPVIGYLSPGPPSPSNPFLDAFRQGLGEAGYVEGQNVAIEYRWAEGHYDRLPALAADLVGRKVDLIMA